MESVIARVLKDPLPPSLRGASATKQSHPSAKVLRLLQLLRRHFASLRSQWQGSQCKRGLCKALLL